MSSVLAPLVATLLLAVFSPGPEVPVAPLQSGAPDHELASVRLQAAAVYGPAQAGYVLVAGPAVTPLPIPLLYPRVGAGNTRFAVVSGEGGPISVAIVSAGGVVLTPEPKVIESRDGSSRITPLRVAGAGNGWLVQTGDGLLHVDSALHAERMPADIVDLDGTRVLTARDDPVRRLFLRPLGFADVARRRGLR